MSSIRRYSNYRLTKKDYLRFFKEVLDYYEKDFPKRMIEKETLTRIHPLKILISGNITRWAAVEASMFEFTGKKKYAERANELMQAIVQ